MTHISSEIQDDSSKDESTGSAASFGSLLCDHTLTGDSDLRSVIEEKAFQLLSARSFTRRPHDTFCVSEPGGDNEFRSLTFPRKLWKIVENNQFKSICWDERGTSVVIHEELFKREVLERKAPFRIFETASMKSLVRQLHLYGFRKVQQSFQRSASLADFLAEEKEVSVLSKLHFYQNPNFQRGCPHLLLRMKRRVGIKHASPAASKAQNSNKKHSGTGNPVGNQNSGFLPDTRAECIFSTATNFTTPAIGRPATSQRIASTTAPIRSELCPPPSALGSPSEQSVMNQHALLNQLTTFHMCSHSSGNQANGHIVNFITSTTSTSQYITSTLQRSYFGMMDPSTLPTKYPDLSVNDGPFFNLQPAGNPWFPMAMTADTSAATLSRSTRQPPSLGECPPDFK